MGRFIHGRDVHVADLSRITDSDHSIESVNVNNPDYIELSDKCVSHELYTNSEGPEHEIAYDLDTKTLIYSRDKYYRFGCSLLKKDTSLLVFAFVTWLLAMPIALASGFIIFTSSIFLRSFGMPLTRKITDLQWSVFCTIMYPLSYLRSKIINNDNSVITTFELEETVTQRVTQLSSDADIVAAEFSHPFMFYASISYMYRSFITYDDRIIYGSWLVLPLALFAILLYPLELGNALPIFCIDVGLYSYALYEFRSISLNDCYRALKRSQG